MSTRCRIGHRSETGEAPHRNAFPARVTGRGRVLSSWPRPGTTGSCFFTVQLPAALVHRIMLQRDSSRHYRTVVRLLLLQAS